MKIKTIYIDDDDLELKKYKKKFEEDERSKDRFEIITRNDQELPKDLGELRTEKAELILVDFDLTRPKNDMLIGISGVALSTAFREKFSEIPMVLFTRRSVFKIEQYSRQVLSSLDETLYKSEVFKMDKHNLDFLYELAIGYKRLRKNQSKEWTDLLKILKAPESDYDDLKLSNPPLISGSKWTVPEAANWIRNILIKYPGILYDPIHSATFLGVSEDAFLSEPIQKFFAKAKYSGVFAPSEGRWWKSKLLEIAISKMDKKERDLPVREGFPSTWERIEKKQIERSKCVFSGESPAEWVCYILHKPVMIKYSLTYRVDSRPEVMDEARVSFEAVRISNKVNDELFDPLGREMLIGIRKMKKKVGSL